MKPADGNIPVRPVAGAQCFRPCFVGQKRRLTCRRQTIYWRSRPAYGVVESDFGWNFKINADGTLKGQLNIVEKMSDGGVRHFKLRADEVWSGSPVVYLNCTDARVEGINSDGYRIAAHFRPQDHPTTPNVVWYYIIGPGGDYVSSTDYPGYPDGWLTLSGPISIDCGS